MFTKRRWIEPEEAMETLYDIFMFLRRNNDYDVEAQFTFNPSSFYNHRTIIICDDFLRDLTKSLTIKKVIYNDPATIVFWEDGTKTIVKCQEGDSFSKETGLAMAFLKRIHGNKGDYNEMFKKWAYDE